MTSRLQQCPGNHGTSSHVIIAHHGTSSHVAAVVHAARAALGSQTSSMESVCLVLPGVLARLGLCRSTGCVHAPSSMALQCLLLTAPSDVGLPPPAGDAQQLFQAALKRFHLVGGTACDDPPLPVIMSMT